MKTECLLGGYYSPDAQGIVFYVHIQAQSWRIHSDRCFIQFDIMGCNNTVCSVWLEVSLPLCLFFNNYKTTYDFTGPNGQHISCWFDLGHFVVQCKEFIICRDLTMLVDEQRDAIRYLECDTYTGQVIPIHQKRERENQMWGIKRDPWGNICSFVAPSAVIYGSCNEFIPYDRDRMCITLREVYVGRNITEKALPPRIKTKYEAVGVLLVKDENEYLDEWFDEGVKTGFQHFYVYDNSEDNSVYIPTRYKDMVTVVSFQAVRHLQYECYQHFLYNYGKTTRWFACFDADEIWTGPLLDTLHELQDEVAGLHVRWTLHGADGQVKWKEGTQFERFPTVINPPTWPFGKGIYQSACVQTVYTHNVTMHPAYLQYHPDGNVIHVHDNTIQDIPKYKLKCHHFITRSLEEYYYKKILRGSCDNGYLRKMSEFLQYNPDMKEEYKQFCLEKGIGDLEMPRHKVV